MASPDTEILIVGAGPAGLSAALTLSRQAHPCIVFDSGSYRNDPSSHMHIVPTWDHKAPADYRAATRENITSRYDTVQFQDAEITNIQKLDNGLFEASDASGRKWTGNKVLLATGVEDLHPSIDGYAELWGHGIYHCLFCKGFEDRGAKSSGVLAIDFLGTVMHALHVARQGLQLTKSVTIYTNGADELAAEIQAGMGTAQPDLIKVDNRKISRFAKGTTPGGDKVIVHFADGSEPVSEPFIAHGPLTKARGPFVEQLGLETLPNGDIKTNPPFAQTSVEGVFAGGDCSNPMKTILNSELTGSLAAVGASAQLAASRLGQKGLV